MTRKYLLAGLLMVSTTGGLLAQTSSAPEKGTLLLTGGDLVKSAIERFVSLAGGPDASFVYIPTAASGIKLDSGFIYIPPDSDTLSSNTREFEMELSKTFSVSQISVLHTRNRETANSR